MHTDASPRGTGKPPRPARLGQEPPPEPGSRRSGPLGGRSPRRNVQALGDAPLEASEGVQDGRVPCRPVRRPHTGLGVGSGPRDRATRQGPREVPAGPFLVVAALAAPVCASEADTPREPHVSGLFRLPALACGQRLRRQRDRRPFGREPEPPTSSSTFSPRAARSERPSCGSFPTRGRPSPSTPCEAAPGAGTDSGTSPAGELGSAPQPGPRVLGPQTWLRPGHRCGPPPSPPAALPSLFPAEMLLRERKLGFAFGQGSSLFQRVMETHRTLLPKPQVPRQAHENGVSRPGISSSEALSGGPVLIRSHHCLGHLHLLNAAVDPAGTRLHRGPGRPGEPGGAPRSRALRAAEGLL